MQTIFFLKMNKKRQSAMIQKFLSDRTTLNLYLFHQFRIIFDNFSETQHERYESWLKSNFQIARIKKVDLNFTFLNLNLL